MKNTNRTLLNNRMRKHKAHMEYLHDQIKKNQFGVAEGVMGTLLREIMITYGVMLQVQDEVIENKGRKS